MNEKKAPFFRLSGMTWILYTLLAITAVVGIYYYGENEAPAYLQCKESLFQQMFDDTCTPRDGTVIIKEIPASRGFDT